MQLDHAEEKQRRLRLLAGGISLATGIVVLALKFYVYTVTGSTAVFSDAMESIVNVVAAGFAIMAIRAAHAPPDDEHPYGHGKLEFVNAVFEGGLITFAAIMIGYKALDALIYGRPAPDLSNGLYVMVLAGALNGALGIFLVVVGKRTHSVTLEADGKHVLSDFYTTIGIILGLGAVKWTGLAWLDPAIAIVFAFVLGFTGIPLVRKAVDGLIDAADETLLAKICDSVERNRMEGIIRLHHVRAMRNGRRIHIDGHIVIPEFWTVVEAHDAVDEFQARMVRGLFPEAEVEFHSDPCRRLYCSLCEVKNCPVRAKPFGSRPPMTVAELIRQVDITDRG